MCWNSLEDGQFGHLLMIFGGFDSRNWHLDQAACLVTCKVPKVQLDVQEEIYCIFFTLPKVSLWKSNGLKWILIANSQYSLTISNIVLTPIWNKLTIVIKVFLVANREMVIATLVSTKILLLILVSSLFKKFHNKAHKHLNVEILSFIRFRNWIYENDPKIVCSIKPLCISKLPAWLLWYHPPLSSRN